MNENPTMHPSCFYFPEAAVLLLHTGQRRCMMCSTSSSHLWCAVPWEHTGSCRLSPWQQLCNDDVTGMRAEE